MLDAKTANRTVSLNAHHASTIAAHPSPHVQSYALGADGPEQLHHTMPVSRIMTTQVTGFSPETSIEVATRVLLQKGISGAPVLDADGHPTGMISKTDLLEAWQTRAQSRQSGVQAPQEEVVVGDIMVPYLLAISHRAPISLAAALMAYEGVQRLVVLGESNKMVGLVTSLDIVRWTAEISGFGLARTTRLQRA